MVAVHICAPFLQFVKRRMYGTNEGICVVIGLQLCFAHTWR